MKTLVRQLRELAEEAIATADAANAAYAIHEPHTPDSSECPNCDAVTEPLQKAYDDATDALEDALGNAAEPKADVTSIPVPLLLKLLIELERTQK